MANLREQIENELQLLYQELTQLKTNNQYLNQSVELVSSAIKSLEQINTSNQKLTSEFENAISENLSEWKEETDEFSRNINISISQIAVIIEELTNAKNQTLLHEIVTKELSNQAEVLNNVKKLIEVLSKEQEERYKIQSNDIRKIQDITSKSKISLIDKLNESEEKAFSRFTENTQLIEQNIEKIQKRLDLTDAQLNQKYQEIAKEIEQVNESLVILNAKVETTIISQFMDWTEKGRKNQNLILTLLILTMIISFLNMILFLIPKI